MGRHVIDFAGRALSDVGCGKCLVRQAAVAAFGIDMCVSLDAIDVLLEDVGVVGGAPVLGGVRCLSPDLVLEALPLSPDYVLLAEQRATLAEVLFHDRMDDAELAEFHRYVRRF